ncbi:MAG: hypothetical protein WA584_19435 [Pyrinomonadaceae bacterium]
MNTADSSSRIAEDGFYIADERFSVAAGEHYMEDKQSEIVFNSIKAALHKNRKTLRYL